MKSLLPNHQDSEMTIFAHFLHKLSMCHFVKNSESYVYIMSICLIDIPLISISNNHYINILEENMNILLPHLNDIFCFLQLAKMIII